jgi:hypothetical protein
VLSPARPWFVRRMKLSTVINVALSPIYVPVCLGMWAYFYVTDMQRCHDEMLSEFERMSRAISERNRNA